MSSDRSARGAARSAPPAADADPPDRSADAEAIVPEADAREPGEGYEIVGFWHLDHPEPRLGELAIALLGRPRPFPVFCAVAATAVPAATLTDRAGGIAAAAVAAAWLAWRGATSGLIGRWRRDRKHRRELNAPAARDERRLLLGRWAERSAGEAMLAWEAYVADAVVGRVQSVIHDRPPPRLGAIEALAGIDAAADRHGIAFARGHTARPAATLPVPPDAAFEPDIVSPTLMNISAASLRHAREEGPRRAARRRRAVADHAAALGPAYQDARNAAAVLRHADLLRPLVRNPT